jgi:hypothetical protein
MATDEKQKQRRTPFKARLPQVPLSGVLPVVEALASLGTPSTPHVLAQAMGTSYGTDARFRTRLGAAGYYGFVEKDEDRRLLTKRGEDVVSDDEEACERARRQAVMSTTFGPIIHSLRGRTVNEATVALRVQGDYGAPEASAPKIAGALVESATEAGLIADDRFDAAAIEAYAEFIPEEVPPAKGTAATRQNGTQSQTGGRAPTTPKERKPDRGQNGKKEEVSQPPFVPGVQVVVNIDASNLTPAQIAELVRALQAPLTAS